MRSVGWRGPTKSPDDILQYMYSYEWHHTHACAPRRSVRWHDGSFPNRPGPTEHGCRSRAQFERPADQDQSTLAPHLYDEVPKASDQYGVIEDSLYSYSERTSGDDNADTVPNWSHCRHADQSLAGRVLAWVHPLDAPIPRLSTCGGVIVTTKVCRVPVASEGAPWPLSQVQRLTLLSRTSSEGRGPKGRRTMVLPAELKM